MNPNTFQALGIVCAGASTLFALLAALRLRRSWQPEQGPTDHGPSLWRRLAAPLALRFRPGSQSEVEELQNQLERGGRRGQNAIDRFLEERVALAFIGAIAAPVVGSLIGQGLGFLFMLLIIIGSIVLPSRMLEVKAGMRRDAVAGGMPSAVDLLVTCLDAGLSIDQALNRVARELGHASPILAEELATTAQEMEAGVSLPDALRRLARRVGLDELSAMCGVIAQAHSLGAPISMTLRDYATSARRQRMSELEERAGKLSSQITLPLATCLLPAALLIILGPAAIQLMQAFNP